jgi:hypothetical protein
MSPKKKPKDRLKWLIDHGHVAPEFADLGERILLLSEGKVREPHPHMHFDQGSGGGNGGGGAMARVSAHQRWDRLFKAVGPKGEAVVSAIIVESMTLDEAAKALSLHPKAILPLLQFSLDIIGRAA